MAQQDRSMTEAEKKDLILAAIRTLNFGEYKNPAELEMAICTRLRTFLNILSDGSQPMRMLDAIPIVADIISVEFEESSQRYKATFRARNAQPDDDNEIIRSDRIDGRNGRTVKKLWEGIVPGKRCVIYKLTEETNNKNKPKVRVAPYVAIIGNTPSATQ